jgi:hypothetical protein
MHTFSRYAAIFFLSFVLVFVPFGTTVMAEQSSAYGSDGSEDRGSGEILFDFFGTRPIGILATATGIAVYLVSLPFSVLGENTDEVGQKLVKEPAVYTFKRPLGEL